MWRTPSQCTLMINDSVKEARPIRLQHFHNSTVLLKEIAVTSNKSLNSTFFCLALAYQEHMKAHFRHKFYWCLLFSTEQLID